METLRALFALARPKQWVKNVFVLTALIFSGKVFEPWAIWHTMLAFIAFCIASSAIYFLNDYRDVEEDRKHPRKRTRPLASGALPRWLGLFGFVILAALAMALAVVMLNLPTAIVVGLYVALNLAYSMGLKHVVIIDVLVISAGFVLRILAGAAALLVVPSTWLVLCGVTISLFLGFTKRRAEVVLLGDRAAEHRKVLADYSPAFLDQMIATVTAATIVCYALYTVDVRTQELVGSRALILSVPLGIYGIFRYLYLVYHDKSGGDPTRAVFTDVPLLLTGGIWAVLCTSLILFGKSWGAFLF